MWHKAEYKGTHFDLSEHIPWAHGVDLIGKTSQTGSCKCDQFTSSDGGQPDGRGLGLVWELEGAHSAHQLTPKLLNSSTSGLSPLM